MVGFSVAPVGAQTAAPNVYPGSPPPTYALPVSSLIGLGPVEVFSRLKLGASHGAWLTIASGDKLFELVTVPVRDQFSPQSCLEGSHPLIQMADQPQASQFVFEHGRLADVLRLSAFSSPHSVRIWMGDALFAPGDQMALERGVDDLPERFAARGLSGATLLYGVDCTAFGQPFAGPVFAGTQSVHDAGMAKLSAPALGPQRLTAGDIALGVIFSPIIVPMYFVAKATEDSANADMNRRNQRDIDAQALVDRLTPGAEAAGGGAALASSTNVGATWRESEHDPKYGVLTVPVGDLYPSSIVLIGIRGDHVEWRTGPRGWQGNDCADQRGLPMRFCEGLTPALDQ
jgi:hypothetical protein